MTGESDKWASPGPYIGARLGLPRGVQCVGWQKSTCTLALVPLSHDSLGYTQSPVAALRAPQVVLRLFFNTEISEQSNKYLESVPCVLLGPGWGVATLERTFLTVKLGKQSEA